MSTPSDRPWQTTVLGLVALGVLVAVWYIAGLPTGYLRLLIANTFFVGLSAAAAFLCWHTATRLGTAGRPWRFIGLGCAMWSFGSLVWGAYELVWRVPVPYPSLADAGYILFYPFCCVGLALAIRQADDDGPPLPEVLLDGLLVLAAAGCVGYDFLLVPALDDSGPIAPAVLVSLLWQAGTMALLFLSLFALVSRPELLGRSPLVGLILGFAIFSVANVSYGVLALKEEYRVGDLVDLGWHEGLILIGVSALMARRKTTGDGSAAHASRRWRSIAPRTTATVVSALVAAGLGAHAVIQPDSDPGVAVAVIVIGILIAARLGYAAVQAQQLQQRTRERDRLAVEAAAAQALAEANGALRAEQAFSASLVECHADGVFAFDLDCRFTVWNPRMEATTGLPKEDVLGQLAFDRLPFLRATGEDRCFAEALAGNTACMVPQPNLFADTGRDGIYESRYAPLRNAAGEVIGGLCVVRDVTARMEAEAELARERDFLRALMDSVPDLVYFKDEASRFVRLNAPAARALGCNNPAHAIGKTDADFFPDGAAWVKEEERVLRGGETIVNRMVEHTSEFGERRWVLSTKVPLRDASGTIVGLVGVGRDVTELKNLEDRMAHQAFHDPLTGLPNRALFHDRLEHAIRVASRRGEPLAVLFLDLDGFKLVNDSFGHETGDGLLAAVGRRLSKLLRDGDTFARLGGDEFGAILEGITGAPEAQEVAGRLLEALSSPFSIGGREVFAGVSIGIAISRPEMNGPGDLLREADVALYQAKGSGRRTAVVFQSEMAAAVAARVALESDLRHALDRDELDLHYQPIVELATGRIIGAEALLRWDHPDRGMVEPSEFIPLAEETGLIMRLGDWVLNEACRQAARWQPEEPGHNPFVVGVNVSARQFRDPGLVDDVRGALARSNLPAAALMLEITEHALLDEGASTATTLDGLHRLGVRLAIDDFGTGYSSLGYLRHLPVDALKMDRVFTRGLGHEAGGAAIVEAIVGLANALGMGVTAEGVETPEQHAFLRSVGCDHMQGFLVSPALSASEFTTLIANGQRATPGQERSTILVA